MTDGSQHPAIPMSGMGGALGKDWCSYDLEGNRPKGVGVEGGRRNWVEEEVGQGHHSLTLMAF